LAITKPCKVGWDKMTTAEKGKHCAHCNKTVTDFTNYTDKELVDFFKQANGSVCGRFESHQMNRALPLAEANSNSFIYKAIFGSAIAASIVTAVNGQDINQPSNTIATGAGETHSTIKIQKRHPVALHYLKGKIVDRKTKVPIGSATVTIKGTNISATTDIDGVFAIPLPDSALNKKIILVSDYYYYREKRTTISAGNSMEFLTIMLKSIPIRSRKGKGVIHGEVTRFL
jgi:hypothetical protein